MSSQPSGSGFHPITTDQLVAAAAKLFRSRGYTATTTRQLSSELGIQRSSLYHHISGKEDLLFEISMRSLNRILEAGRVTVGRAPAEQRLRELIAVHLEVALQDQDMHSTMLIELNQLSAGQRAIVVEKRDEYENLVRDQIIAEQDAGRIRTDVSARHLTLALMNLLNWTIFWYRDGGADMPDEIAKVFITIFFDGARA